MPKWRFRRGGTANRARSRRVGRVSQARQSPGHDDFPEKARQLAGLSSKRVQAVARTPSVEVVVHADAGDVFPGVPSVSNLESSCRSNISNRRVTAEVKVKVLQLGRPITCELPSGTNKWVFAEASTRP